LLTALLAAAAWCGSRLSPVTWASPRPVGSAGIPEARLRRLERVAAAADRGSKIGQAEAEKFKRVEELWSRDPESLTDDEIAEFKELSGGTNPKVVKALAGQAEENITYTSREVIVDDREDLNELLRLPDPVSPAEGVVLEQVITDDGRVIMNPDVKDLKGLKISKIRPHKFIWKDTKESTSGEAPKEYDQLIQKIMGASPEELEDIVRMNYNSFDEGFYIRTFMLEKNTDDPGMRQRFKNVRDYVVKIMNAARQQTQMETPKWAIEAEIILRSTIDQGGYQEWPMKPEVFSNMADTVRRQANMALYDNAWFDQVITMLEVYGAKAKENKKEVELNICSEVMQRVITEWLRRDALWEETKEGKMIFRMLELSDKQWADLFRLSSDPFNVAKAKDEIKIISEMKLITLPIGCKLQMYAAKYLDGLVQFLDAKEKLRNDPMVPSQLGGELE